MPLQTLDVNDIAEVRLGTHSIGFVRTSCTDKFREVSQNYVFSIIKNVLFFFIIKNIPFFFTM